MRIDLKLYLYLKAEYFDKIVSGEKKEVFRLYNRYWKEKLKNKNYESIILYNGKRTVERPWKSWMYREIIHPQFGDKKVGVFAIKVND